MMRRMLNRSRWWLPALAALACLGQALAAPPAPEQLLPASTTGFVAISDLTKLQQSWNQTQLAKLMADPAMKPFLDEVIPSTKGSNYLLETMGVGWDTVRNACAGDLGWGLILAGNNQVSHVLTLDMTGRQQAANVFFNEIGKSLQAQGANLAQRTIDGMPCIVADLPKNRQIIYGINENVMVCTDHLSTLQGIIARWHGTANDSIGNTQAFQKVRERTQSQAGEMALVRWYFDPLARAEAQMIFQPELKKGKGDNLVQTLRKEGVDAIKGAGGTLAMSSNGMEMLARVAVCAPAPFRGAMRMAKLPNDVPAMPDTWVPADVSSWATFCIDVVNAYDSFDTLFERLADEEPGTFKEIMKSLRDDPDGPQVDVRREIFEQLTNRVTIINDASTPINERSERFLAGILLKDQSSAPIVANGIRKCFENDKRFQTHMILGTTVWEYHPKGAKAKPGRERAVTLPTTSVAVAGNVLFVTTRAELLEKVLRNAGQSNLAETPDYRRMTAELTRLGMGPGSIRYFGRVEEGARTTYEMMRAGKLAKVDSAYARILLQFMKIDEKGDRLRADGGKLPDYQRVAHYLGLVGSFTTTYPDGWSIVGVTLKR